MRKNISVVLLISLILACTAKKPSKTGHGDFSASAAITRDQLFAGANAPERRDFPVNPNVSPCEDFHAYVCGPAETSFKLPAHRSAWIFSMSDSNERILQAKKNFFKQLAQGYSPKFERTRNALRLYKACMNVEARKADEVAFVKDNWEKISAAKDSESLRKLVDSRLLTPDFAPISTELLTSQANPEYNDLLIVADGMSLPEKSYYDQKEAVRDLQALAVALFRELKIDEPGKRADAVVAFETGLAKTYPTPTEIRELVTSNTYVKRQDLVSLYPHIDLNHILSQVPEATPIRNITKESMAYLDGYLATASPFDIQSVLMFHSVKGVMDDAYPEFFKVSFEFARKHHGGPVQRASRDERCTKSAMSVFGMEIDAELIDILFPDFDRKEVIELAETVRQSILNGLQQNAWLSASARAAAIKKIKEAPLKLVRPVTEEEWNFLDVKPLSDDNPVENAVEIARAKIVRMLKDVRGKRNRDRWHMSPLSVNAYYSPGDNKFVLPQGILQYPFYSSKQSRVENLAAMGMVTGHELGHAVDDQGSKYDSTGKLAQWMMPADQAEFATRTIKLVDQFNRVGHDGKLTLGENIGDNVGLSFALAAAFPKTDEAPLNEVKSFFEAYARAWCGVYREDYLKMALKTDPHAQNFARINQQVMHKDLFHKAYQCKPGDRMFRGPENRVQVW